MRFKPKRLLGTALLVDASAATTIIDGKRSSTVTISSPAHVTISNVTIRNGVGTFAGATREGGGILNQGTLRLISSTVSGNTVVQIQGVLTPPHRREVRNA
jgi:hypothetical protein